MAKSTQRTLALLFLGAATCNSFATSIEIVSVPTVLEFMPSNGDSGNTRGSADSRFLVFDSRAENLVASDNNRYRDVFLVDTVGGINLLSRAPEGQANGESRFPDITPDGAFIVFSSRASNLVPDDTNGVEDIFVVQRNGGAITRLMPAGVEANGASRMPRISADGQRIVFLSAATNWTTNDTNGLDDAFVVDRGTGAVTRASVAVGNTQITDHAPFAVQITADGECVSFESASSQLVPGDTNNALDVFLHHVPSQGTIRESVGSNGAQIDGVTANRHLLMGCNELVFHSQDGSTTSLGIPGYFLRRNGLVDLLPTGNTQSFPPPPAAISRNNRWLFVGGDQTPASRATERIDLQTFLNYVVTPFPDAFGEPSAVSDDGSHWTSTTIRPVAPQDRNVLNDIVLREVSGPLTRWISISDITAPAVSGASGDSGRGFGIYGAALPTWHRRHHAISGDGRFVAFSSNATNLWPQDSNGVEDVFIRDRVTPNTVRVSHGPSNSQLDQPSAVSDLSGSGRQVLMESCATFGLPDTNNVCDLYLKDLDTGVTEKINESSAGVDADREGNPITGHWGRMSSDARYIVFRSLATTLVAGTPTAATRIFVRDRTLGTLRTLGFGTRPAISRNGRFIAFVADFTVMVHDQQTMTTTPLDFPQTPDTPLDWPSLSEDGRFVVFQSDATNLVANDDDTNRYDVFLHDRETGTTSLVSIDAPPVPGARDGASAEISPDGRWIAYLPLTNTAEGTFESRGILVDRETGQRRAFVDSTDVQVGQDYLTRPRFSADSQTLVFGASGLSRRNLDTTSDMNDIFVAPVDAGALFGNGFE